MKERLQVILTISKNGCDHLVPNKKFLKFLKIQFPQTPKFNQKRPSSFSVFIMWKNNSKKLLDFSLDQTVKLYYFNSIPSSDFKVIIRPKQIFKECSSFEIFLWFEVVPSS